MRARLTPYGLVAGLLAATACSHAQTPAERTQAAAESSQQAFQRAADDQKKLEDQQKSVEAAHQETLKAQNSLQQAQRHEEQERAKAQQLQQQANSNLDQATRQARQAREATGQPSGVQSVVGRIAEAAPGYVVLQTPGGQRMPFRLDDRTTVLVGNEQRSTADIQQGADARVAYTGNPGGAQATALSVQVTPIGTPGSTGYSGTGSQGTAAPMPPSNKAIPMPSTQQ